MGIYHPAGYSASPAADWHLRTSPWFSSCDGWTYKKEMLNISGRLCPAKPCGSSAAVLREQGTGGGDMACACKLPAVFPAKDELSTFSGRMWGKHWVGRGLGNAIPSSPRLAYCKLWSTESCDRAAQGKGLVASSPMCKWLATCSG